MATGLQPPVQTAVAVQDHAPAPDHDGGRGDVGQVGAPVERMLECVQLARTIARERASRSSAAGLSPHGRRPAIDLGIACPAGPTA